MDKSVWVAVGRNPFAKVIITDSSNKIIAKGDSVEQANEQLEVKR